MTQPRKITKKRKEYTKRLDEEAVERYIRRWPDAKKSTDHEDMFDHVDYWHVRNGERFGVDLKGNKHPNQLWVEFKNVNGKEGWINGKAKWIVYDIPQMGGFAGIERLKLRDWCIEHVDPKHVKKPKDAYKKIYSRSDWAKGNGEPQEDLITFIKIEDLKSIETYWFTPYKE
tara:strand:+ start:23 stop:538 length:516 start_codon:yes stop_codon:yes gene_type:complete